LNPVLIGCGSYGAVFKVIVRDETNIISKDNEKNICYQIYF